MKIEKKNRSSLLPLLMITTVIIESCSGNRNVFVNTPLECNTVKNIWIPDNSRTEYISEYYDKSIITSTGLVFSEVLFDSIILNINSRYVYIGNMKDSSYKFRFENRIEILHNVGDTIDVELRCVATKCKFKFSIDKDYRFIYLRYVDPNLLSVEYSSYVRYNCCF
jgi:hypothetical protein